MSAFNWRTTPLVIPDKSEPIFSEVSGDVMIDADPGAGTVEIQWRNAAGDWETFETITERGAYPMIVANGRARRIVATGGATFCATWSA